MSLALFFSLTLSASYVWPTSYGGKTDLDWTYHNNKGDDGKANLAYYANKGEDLRWLTICLFANGGADYDAYARSLLSYYNSNQNTNFSYPTGGINSPAPAMIDAAVMNYLSSLSSETKANANVASAISSYHALTSAVKELREKAYQDQIIYNYELVPSLMRDAYQNIVHAVSQYENPEVPLSFHGASLALQSDFSILFSVKRSDLKNGNYSDPYAVFTMNGKAVTVRTYTEKDGMLYFRFANIAPYQMNDRVSAVLYATKQNGELATSEAEEYGISTYCKRMLENATTSTPLKTLIVDLLNYGAASQIYTAYKTDQLPTAFLTAAQQALATTATPLCHSVTNSSYATISSPSASWTSASLILRDRVSVQIKFQTNDASNYTVRIETPNGNLLHTVTPDNFVDLGAGLYTFRYDGITSLRFSDTATRAGITFALCIRPDGLTPSLTIKAEVTNRLGIVF